MIGILVNIRSAENVGSMFRTADAAGFAKLYLCGITPAPLDRFGRPMGKLIKTSLGAEKSVAWEKVGSGVDVRPTLRLLTRLKRDGFRLIAVEQDPAAVPYYRVKLSRKEFQGAAVIVGNEINGLPRSILRCADVSLEIPMQGAKESLNVAVAFGIVAYALRYH